MTLAAAQGVSSTPSSVPSLVHRLRDNAAALLKAHHEIAHALDRGQAITPAAEWLVDNYHIVEEQVREIRTDLPSGYYRQLPKLAAGPFIGYPRIFGLAWAFIAHTDSHFDSTTLLRFVNAYQRVQPLTIGELWAIAITLRIVLVENLRRMAARIILARGHRHDADMLANRLLGVNGKPVEAVSVVLQPYAKGPLPPALAVQLVQRLRDQDPNKTPALEWLEAHLGSHGTSSEAIVQEEQQRQGASNVTVRNIITSMRLISDIDWAELVESVSLVDAAFRASSQFAQMDFPTRNLYRGAIEELARGSRYTELEIANKALSTESLIPPWSTEPPQASFSGADDPGYYLIAGGRPEFEKSIDFSVPPHLWFRRFARRIGIAGYITCIGLLAAAITALPLIFIADGDVGSWLLVLLAGLGLVPALDVAVALINRDLTRGVGAVILPGLELADGVPALFRTMVVVPTLLTSKASIDDQIAQLEVHFLTSPGGAVYFALLTDWADAECQQMPADEDLLAAATAGMSRLNERYSTAADPRFFLLHRRRIWNPTQSQWMGWERKRGKLHELNRLLRGAADTSFVDVGGLASRIPADIRYVITLDADTRLPREALRRLIGKMAHPLNRPKYDPVAGRVVDGYAILQPRVTPSLPIGREGSLFQRVVSSPGGIDPYAAAASDLYQDLFGEGSYTGKGIYDLETFEAALDQRIPENAVLSHDLIEGIFARAGLASDIEVVEEFPSRYDVAAARQHRWARGDWQLVPWLLGHHRGSKNRNQGAIPPIGVWKVVDNLRRTLVPPVAVAALIAGWTQPLPIAAIWSLFVLLTIMVPPLIPVLAAIIPRHIRVTPLSHLDALGTELRLAFSRTALQIILLAHQAWLMVDAIGRTLYRLYVSHRNLLEWVTAAQMTIGDRLGIPGFVRQMFGGVMIAVVAAGIVWIAGSGAWPIALPIIFSWLLSPAIAYWVSRSPGPASRLAISEQDIDALRVVARRTWRYFETFVTTADRMLPPDNFQEDPKAVLAHRTSPTNIGLYLLSVVSARDFGWIGRFDAVERVSTTLATMGQLERFRGHFFNWYDTQDLRPLDPKYVSTVDSGNLAGHLLALAQACREWREHPVIGPGSLLNALQDALYLAREALQTLRAGRQEIAEVTSLDQALEVISASIDACRIGPQDATAILAELMPLTTEIAAKAAALALQLNDDATDVTFWANAIQTTVESHLRDLAPPLGPVDGFADQLLSLEQTARHMALAMEFGFLLNRERNLLSIGFLVSEGTLDPSCYDLLASEARLASLFAIAKSDIPTRHWFRLGRAATPVGRGAALISWSGSMFEYLMPSLVMRAPANSLLEQTSRLVVNRQVSYGARLGLPWGISESAYNARDLEFTYQYSSFGVPGLGLKRGLGESAVIAPYATGLATMVAPAVASRNFRHLAAMGAQGRYGFYEALDFTRKHLRDGQSVAVICAFMSHHQGMTIIAIGNALFEGAMRTRFHSDPIIQATDLLLQERTPRDVVLEHPKAEGIQTAGTPLDFSPTKIRRFRSPHDSVPATHLFSNGRYAVMLTAAGSGYSRWKGMAITRWREDITRDNWGSYIFLRDRHRGKIWSAGYQPSGVEADKYRASFSEDRAEIVRRDGALITTLEVVISAENDSEVRRVSISNTATEIQEIEITSYVELVLAAAEADAAHPAFSKLFIETEYLAEIGALIATRRRRSPAEPEIWVAQIMVMEGEALGPLEVETDRARFLGRGNDLRQSNSMNGQPLSGTTGTVLDPIFALRRCLRVPARGTARAAIWTVVASSRQEVLDLIDKHQDANAFERASTLAWTQAQVQLRHLNINADEANTFQRLGSHILYANGALRAPGEMIRRGSAPQAGLWQHGISGDTPIVLVRIDDIADIDVVQEALRAHEYWRMKQVSVDLVILNERAASYVQDLQIALETAVRASQSRPSPGEATGRGSAYVLRTDLMSVETRALLPAVARVILTARQGRLTEQMAHIQALQAVQPPERQHRRLAEQPQPPEPATARPDLEFFNGLGGFSEEGREYTTVLLAGHRTPAPWINVISNPAFGFQVVTEGSGYTWSENSREHKLTPWSNDPVGDPPGEAIYIRDEESGEFWGATALTGCARDATYIVRHGHGYSRFEHNSHGIELDLLQFVPLRDPVKIARLTLRNNSGRVRHLSVTTYVEWVLGAERSATAPFIMTRIDPDTGALLAQNPWNNTFRSCTAFVDLGGRQTEWTGDRGEFIGRNGVLSEPAALIPGTVLSNRVGAGFDPCGVLRAPIKLAPGEVTEVAFLLGDAATESEAQAFVKRYRAVDLDAVFREVSEHWTHMLGVIQVKTPDRAMDIMLNGWMLYQTLACRFWARSAFYQASGAFGFRDQLQDSLALAWMSPALTRAHLLHAASRQFLEGDFQHWWLPPLGQGVRTRISDDRVWLAYVTAHYVEMTGDHLVLDEMVSFLEGPVLASDEHDLFFQPMTAEPRASLYDHCALALDRSLDVGSHGLPLIGTGDWNDGMNRVGEGGKGESVWLGWFLYTALVAFAAVAENRGDTAHVETWRSYAAALQAALEREAWDGAWYKRGYFDDGSPLGSAANLECRIDSIAQSWAVLSGAAETSRAEQAMASLDEYLIRHDDKLALLFTPPFDQTEHDPGYIKGYPPGIRENGGQYTHAAAWTILALAKLGDGNKAAGLFSLLNPINHATTVADAERYKVEPYAVAADVYSVPPHVGRGGWTWYTGSAGWMYRAGIEGILGLRRRGAQLLLEPCIPTTWPGFEMTFKFQSTTYRITVTNPHCVSRGIISATLDDQAIPTESPTGVPLIDDGETHLVQLVLGKA
ncbi:MAG TPA: glucoamylase family protein [Dongiaceae bacterium]|nr:glucoamylase family protein [Dongiaceae bacterium]